ncbi:MAG: tetratricopeptide repeat protein [Myxococcota bacterium]
MWWLSLSVALAGTPLTLDQLRADDAGAPEVADRAEHDRLASIEKLKGRLAREPTAEDQADLMLQLAQRYLEQGLYLRARGDASADEWLTRATKLFEGNLRNHPTHPGSDSAQLGLAQCLWAVGRQQEGMEPLKALIEQHPESEHVPEAYVRIAEYYVGAEPNGYRALKGYLKATTYAEGPDWAYATYRLGWSYRQVGEVALAKATWLSLLQRLDRGRPTEDEQQVLTATRAALAE